MKLSSKRNQTQPTTAEPVAGIGVTGVRLPGHDILALDLGAALGQLEHDLKGLDKGLDLEVGVIAPGGLFSEAAHMNTYPKGVRLADYAGFTASRIEAMSAWGTRVAGHQANGQELALGLNWQYMWEDELPMPPVEEAMVEWLDHLHGLGNEA